MDFIKNILDAVFVFLRQIPKETTLFLSVALGYALGRIRFGPVQFGGVCGTLIVALLLGQSGVVVDAGVKNFFFALFIFALGFAGGPQFFANLNAKSAKLILLSLIEVLTVLGLAFGVIHYFGFDPGTAAGLVAGAATESAVIGTATEAIAHLPLVPEVISRLQTNVVTAYSVTYIFGLVAIVLFTGQVAPLLLRLNLRKEAEALWESAGGHTEPDGEATVLSSTVARAYRVSAAAGETVGKLDAHMEGAAQIERVTRKAKALPVSADLVLSAGDTVLVMGQRSMLLRVKYWIGEEVGASAYANMVVETVDYVFTKNGDEGKTLGEVMAWRQKKGNDPEVYVEAVVRNNKSMPLVRGLVLQTGDVLRLRGSQAGIEGLGESIGAKVPRTSRTNFIFIGLGLAVGLLIGRFSWPVGGIVFSLGSGGGALLSGLVCGWLKTHRPAWVGAPNAALEIMKDSGLSFFVACVGLASGPQAWALIRQYGLKLPLVGLGITLIPAIFSLIVGRWVLRLELPVLLGGIAGQQCSTPALSAVQAEAGNATPLMGYTITYAISNALLPFLGPIIVGLSAPYIAGG